MSLLDLIVQDGGTLKRTATTNGPELAGPCLWCGGQDRFRVWPEQDGGRCWCCNCGKHGDTIQYLRDKRGLTFQYACRFIGRDPSEAWTNGLNIRAWVMAGLPQKVSPENTAKREIRIDNGEFLPFPSDWLQRYDEVQLERLAIMTVDGGLSDDEAVYKLRQCVI